MVSGRGKSSRKTITTTDGQWGKPDLQIEPRENIARRTRVCISEQNVRSQNLKYLFKLPLEGRLVQVFATEVKSTWERKRQRKGAWSHSSKKSMSTSHPSDP